MGSLIYPSNTTLWQDHLLTTRIDPAEVLYELLPRHIIETYEGVDLDSKSEILRGKGVHIKSHPDVFCANKGIEDLEESLLTFRAEKATEEARENYCDALFFMCGQMSGKSVPDKRFEELAEIKTSISRAYAKTLVWTVPRDVALNYQHPTLITP